MIPPNERADRPAPDSIEAIVSAAMSMTRAWYAGKRIGDEFLAAIYHACSLHDPTVTGRPTPIPATGDNLETPK